MSKKEKVQPLLLKLSFNFKKLNVNNILESDTVKEND